MKLPALKFMSASPNAGLVIRSREVEILGMRGKTITSRVRVPIEGKEESHLIQAIQKALEAASLKSKKLAVSIPTADVLFRFFNLQSLPKSEWESTVQFEVRKYIPFKTDRLIWGYRAIQPKGASTLEIIFTAIQREAFERLLTTLASAGVAPTSIEPVNLGLARLVRGGNGAESDFICVVDIDQNSAHIAIVKDGLPYLARDISLQINKEPQINASAELDQLAPSDSPGLLSQQTPPALSSDTDPRVQRLLSELSVSISFFAREYRAARVSQVVIFGEESLVGPWCRLLSESLQCAVELGNRWLAPYVEKEIPLTSAVGVGLLLAKTDPSASSLDFLKRRSATKTISAPSAKTSSKAAETLSEVLNIKAIAPLAGAALGIVGALWLFGTQQLTVERGKLSQLTQSRLDSNQILGSMSDEELKGFQTNAQEQLAILKRSIDQRVSFAAKLDGLAHSLPDGVWLTGLNYEMHSDGKAQGQAVFNISGSCYLNEPSRELETIRKFGEQVKRNPKFFSGFRTASVDQINEQTADATNNSKYRTFRLNCNSERRL